MRITMLLLSPFFSAAVFAADCSPRLTFVADVPIDARVVQNLRSAGLDEAGLIALLGGPRVLVEDAQHPSEIVRTVYARSPVDQTVYATEVLADGGPDPASVYGEVQGVVHFRRATEPHQSDLEAMIERARAARAELQAELERIKKMSEPEIQAELESKGLSWEQLTASADRAAALFRSSERDDLPEPANDEDEDEDLDFAAQPTTGAFAGAKVLFGFVPKLQALAYGLGEPELVGLFLDAASEGRSFTLDAAFRTGMPWRPGRPRRLLTTRVRGRYFAVLVDAPNERLRVVEDVREITPATFHRMSADRP